MISLSWKTSIKQKLLAILVVSGTASVFLAAIFLVVLELSELKNTTRTDITSIAKLIANRSIAALLFDDSKVARDNLNALAQKKSVISACIYDAKGSVFASLINQKTDIIGCPALKLEQKTQFKKMRLHTYQVIETDQEKIGTVYILSDLRSTVRQKLQNLSWVLMVLVIALVIIFVLTIPVLRLILRPLARLLKTVNQIATAQDYSLRAKKYSTDEVGDLVDAFNAMVIIVEQQNQSLISAKDRYLTLYNDNPTIIFHLQLNGNIISVNRFGADQLYIVADPLNVGPIDDLIHPQDRQLLKSFLLNCIKNPQQVYKQELRMLCRNGQLIWVRVSARIVVDENLQQNLMLVGQDVTETRLLNEKIFHQARHDALTGLANRHEFDQYVKLAVLSAQTEHQEHALCYLDLDQFKIVNDTSGHLAGDELLRQLGSLLRSHIRKDDLLARLGGDEFGILMHNCSANEAFKACGKLKNIIRDFYFAWEERRFNIGVSIGISVIDSNSTNTVDVLKAADSACYAAKENGRNRVHIFRVDDEELASRQGEMQWLEKIQSGIVNNKFHLFGQLIIPISGMNHGLHFEVLLRYQKDQDEYILPGAFLPAAERYHKTPILDKWVIETLFQYLADSQDFLETLSMCSINLSGLSLSDESMLTFIAEQFDKWKIPFHKICFEITETAAISNLAFASKFIQYWQQRGCCFSLDDFGSGLSSFAYLKNLPVDFLKIDGLFVKDILLDKVDLAMVKSINEVAHVMGKKTIAEFVENEQIFQCLNKIGVDYAQGYGIAKPVPIEQLIESTHVE